MSEPFSSKAAVASINETTTISSLPPPPPPPLSSSSSSAPSSLPLTTSSSKKHLESDQLHHKSNLSQTSGTTCTIKLPVDQQQFEEHYNIHCMSRQIKKSSPASVVAYQHHYHHHQQQQQLVDQGYDSLQSTPGKQAAIIVAGSEVCTTQDTITTIDIGDKEIEAQVTGLIRGNHDEQATTTASIITSNNNNNNNRIIWQKRAENLKREFFNSSFTSTSTSTTTTNTTTKKSSQHDNIKKNDSTASSSSSSSPPKETNTLGRQNTKTTATTTASSTNKSSVVNENESNNRYGIKDGQTENVQLDQRYSSNNHCNLVNKQQRRSSFRQATKAGSSANNNNTTISNTCSADNSDDIATLDDFEEEYEDDTERTICSCNIGLKNSQKQQQQRLNQSKTNNNNNNRNQNRICSHCHRQEQNYSKLYNFWKYFSSWPTSVVTRKKLNNTTSGVQDTLKDFKTCERHGTSACDRSELDPNGICRETNMTRKRNEQRQKLKKDTQNESITCSSSDEEVYYSFEPNNKISNKDSRQDRKRRMKRDRSLQNKLDNQSEVDSYSGERAQHDLSHGKSGQQHKEIFSRTQNNIDLSKINEDSEIEREIEFHKRYAKNRSINSTNCGKPKDLEEMNLKEVKIIDKNSRESDFHQKPNVNHCGGSGGEHNALVPQSLKIVACSDGQFKQIIVTNSAQIPRNIKSPDSSSLNSTVNSCAMSKSSSEVRLRWGKKMDFLLSIIGFAVDLANIWRFPYLCYKNGGGVFLIPYITMLIFGGIPLFFLELLLGQYVKKGPVTVWNKICPSMKGVGYCSILISWYVSFYYNVLIAWSVYFIYRSFTLYKMPWEECNHEWNSNATCMSIRQLRDICSLSNTTLEACKAEIFSTRNVTSPASEFFVKELLELDKSTGLEDMGHLRPELVMCTIVVYLMHYFSLFRGLETSGKVVWVTATAPYMILTILLVRGLFLPGAGMGIAYYLSPKLDKLADPQVWVDAAGQVFYSIGVGFGVHLTYASFNDHHNNCYRDCLVTSAVNAATSVYSGLVVFVYLGYMAKNLGIEIDKVASEGYSLVFEVYPEALTTLPVAKFWSILFFIMLLTLGIDSAMGGLEAVITGLEDEFKIARRLTRGQLTAIVIISSFLPALISCTQGGAYTMYWFDVYSAGVSLLFSALFEAIGVVYCYGLEKFIPNVESMLGRKPHLFYIICWKYVSPLFLGVVIVMSIFSATVPTYRGYTFPIWSVVAGWALAFSSVSAIPIVASIEWIRFWRGKTPAKPTKESKKIAIEKVKSRSTTPDGMNHNARSREQML